MPEAPAHNDFETEKAIPRIAFSIYQSDKITSFRKINGPEKPTFLKKSEFRGRNACCIDRIAAKPLFIII
jgi:hypothetical protein